MAKKAKAVKTKVKKAATKLAARLGKKAGKKPKAKKAAKKKVSWIPEGAHLVTPYLSVRGAADAIDFYKKAFGAREKFRMAMPDGRIGHAEIRIGKCEIFLADEFEESDTRSPAALGGSTASIHLYVPNVDRAYEKAVRAGARASMPPADMFWGDRFGTLVDPFGHAWSLSQHKEDVTLKEMRKRAAAMFGGQQPAA